MAVNWDGNGGISGFNVSGGVGGLRNNVASLTVNGSQNTQIITRLRYNLPSGVNDRMVATCKFDFEFAPNSPAGRWAWSAAMYLVRDQDIPGLPSGATPTPTQIYNAATNFYRGTMTNESPLMHISFRIDGPRAGALSPNTKYWALVAPSWVKMNANYKPVNPPSKANDPVMDISRGRAVSFWTNRPPNKPTITVPADRSVFPANTIFNMAISATDPDAVGGSNFDQRGLNGVQVQIAAQPTPDNPNPSWSDMTCYTISGQQAGWFIDGSTVNNWAAEGLVSGSGLRVKCGVEPSSAEAYEQPTGFIPAGDWQIRVRTMDSGNPYSYMLGGVRPLNGNAQALTPTNYPSDRMSAWSNPVYVSIPVQVPPPLIVTPKDAVAIPLPPRNEDGNIGAVRHHWTYRNTANPPFPQAQRTMQLRRVGETNWLTFTASTSNPFVDIINLSLGHWEWRVKVTDSDGEESNYSEIASYWVVPAPGSGGTRPLPSETIDGATLGCGTHRVFVYRRGGKERVGEIRNLSHVDWSRVRDDISTAKVVVSGWDIDCGNLLSKLQCWAYELVIFRDNGFTTDRVWEGPITLLTYERDSVSIQAKDVMGYAYRRIIKTKMSDSGTGDSVVSRGTRVVQNAFASDDPNVLGYLTPINRDDDAMQYRSTPAYSRTAFEEVDDMAANAGLDYTVVGRAILLWGTKHRIGTLPEFRDEDLGAPPIVSEYGMSMANFYAVSDGNGIYGTASRLDENGEDPIYGLVEMLSSTWASDSASDTGTYTQEGLETVRQSFADFSERSIADRYPPPVVVRVPDNTTLNPDTVLSIQHLVPGVVIPLRSTGTLRTVVANQKLDSVKVTEEDGAETIQITLSPFSRDDASFDEGEDG